MRAFPTTARSMIKITQRLSLALACLLLATFDALAARLPTPAPPALNASSYLVIDADSGAPVAAMNPDLQVEPASLTKLMTAYVVFQALEAGQVALTDEVVISERAHAAGVAGSTMFARLGSRVSVENLLQGMIVVSGNDASVALAEHVAGTEAVFADLMNSFAAELGMVSTRFMNATGLPEENHFSTARDMTTLARAVIRDFPDHYSRYSQREFTWEKVTQKNRNRLLWQDESVDGVKTGSTQAAGFCLVSSALRDDMRLISAVMGPKDARARIDASRALLNYGFRFFETRRLYAAGQSIDDAPVWKGTADAVPLGIATDLFVTVPRGSWDELTPTLTVRRTLYAPLARGDEVGTVSIALDGEELASAPVQVLDAVDRGGLWKRMTDEVRLWFE